MQSPLQLLGNMAPATQLDSPTTLANGHLDGQASQQLANGSLNHVPAKAGKKLSASEKRRQRRRESKKRAVFECVPPEAGEWKRVLCLFLADACYSEQERDARYAASSRCLRGEPALLSLSFCILRGLAARTVTGYQQAPGVSSLWSAQQGASLCRACSVRKIGRAHV